MYNCMTCERSVPDEFVFDGVEDHTGQKLHAVDTGPRHHEVAVHVVTAGAQQFAPTNHRYDEAKFEAMEQSAPAKSSLWSRLRLVYSVTSYFFWADISYYQSILTDAYNRSMVSFRLSFSSSFVDPHALGNLSWAVGAVARKRLVAYMGYHVWYPGNTTAILAKAMAGKWTSKGLLMIDIENWGGAIRGDHSTSITAFIDACVHEFLGGNVKRICVYGNVSDLASIYPHRPSWLKVVVARYDSTAPTVHWDGWQYTDGQTKWPVKSGFPRSSGGIGSCDHNVALMTATTFLSAFGISATPPPPGPHHAAPWFSTNTLDELGDYADPSVHVHGGLNKPGYDPSPAGDKVRACNVDVHRAFRIVLKREPRLDTYEGTTGYWGLWHTNTTADWLEVRKILKLGTLTNKNMTHTEYVTLMRHVGFVI